ncbi:MAG: OmpA family protein [Paracoccus sp. (in: a-proteobacteria)]|jgi:outer membrane protein OmpA-like peptidoglycan-associated protein
MRLKFALAAVAATLIGIAPAIAQDDLSVEQMLGAWQKQKQVFQEAESNGLGRTRGLTLVTVQGAVAAEAAAPQAVPAQPGAAEAPAPVTATADMAAPTDPNKPLVFGQLDPELQVNLQIRFGFDSAALADDQKPRLDKICQAMKQSDVKLFRIVGHTDTSGPDTYNERLSVLRAKEVTRYLTEDCGIAAARLETLGLGERFPLDPKKPDAEENRRVEFQALS